MGKLVLLDTPDTEPQGALLSYAAPHVRSGGHKKATEPISLAASSPCGSDRLQDRKNARSKR